MQHNQILRKLIARDKQEYFGICCVFQRQLICYPHHHCLLRLHACLEKYFPLYLRKS